MFIGTNEPPLDLQFVPKYGQPPVLLGHLPGDVRHGPRPLARQCPVLDKGCARRCPVLTQVLLSGDVVAHRWAAEDEVLIGAVRYLPTRAARVFERDCHRAQRQREEPGPHPPTRCPRYQMLGADMADGATGGYCLPRPLL
eukprot:287599-Rhodomonas_salina.3